jgi:hypothetical protein
MATAAFGAKARGPKVNASITVVAETGNSFQADNAED